VKINQLDSLDVGTIHLYERHMELRPPQWTFCDFPCLMAWMPPYLQSHITVAAQDKKPLIIEETGVRPLKQPVCSLLPELPMLVFPRVSLCCYTRAFATRIMHGSMGRSMRHQRRN
jgi:hypothetical protein